MRFFFFIIFLLNISGFAQQQARVGLLPTINITKKLNHNWKLNGVIQSRHAIFESRPTTGNEYDFYYIQSSYALGVYKKVRANATFGGGYHYQLNSDNSMLHRAILMYSSVIKKAKWNIGHRYRLDYSYQNTNTSYYRGAYRILFQLPLSGDKINDGEFYLKAGTENYMIKPTAGWNIENRLLSFLGYNLNSKLKIEFGLDYRVKDFQQHNYWTSISVFYSL